MERLLPTCRGDTGLRRELHGGLDRAGLGDDSPPGPGEARGLCQLCGGPAQRQPRQGRGGRGPRALTGLLPAGLPQLSLGFLPPPFPCPPRLT